MKNNFIGKMIEKSMVRELENDVKLEIKGVESFGKFTINYKNPSNARKINENKEKLEKSIVSTSEMLVNVEIKALLKFISAKNQKALNDYNFKGASLETCEKLAKTEYKVQKILDISRKNKVEMLQYSENKAKKTKLFQFNFKKYYKKVVKNKIKLENKKRSKLDKIRVTSLKAKDLRLKIKDYKKSVSIEKSMFFSDFSMYRKMLKLKKAVKTIAIIEKIQNGGVVMVEKSSPLQGRERKGYEIIDNEDLQDVKQACSLLLLEFYHQKPLFFYNYKGYISQKYKICNKIAYLLEKQSKANAQKLMFKDFESDEVAQVLDRVAFENYQTPQSSEKYTNKAYLNREILKTLTKNQIEIYLMKSNGYSFQEIAKAQNVAKSTVSTIFYRVQKYLDNNQKIKKMFNYVYGIN